MDQSKRLCERISHLGLPRWRAHISDLVRQYVETPFLKYPERFEQEEKWRWDAIKAPLAKYEHRERLALLELAIIKSTRCLTIGNDNDKLNKAAFATCDLSDIIPFVVQFLGKAPSIAD